MDSDEEDFVFFGTPIEREDELASRKKKAVAEASGTLRTLPAWNQEVRDEEGRRRFHGAFTGGFSAGYFNTAGSKEGWTPQTFTSSRKNRADFKQQNILNFLDDDEKAEMEGKSLETSMKFDTFGFTAAEIARKQSETEQKQRPSAIPGPVPDELIVSATDSIGVKLLLKMGWRHGHSIKDSQASKYDTLRTARKAFLALSSDDAKEHLTDIELAASELQDSANAPSADFVQRPQSTPVYVLNPKQDLHGLGFDPFKHAPEFREKKRSRASDGRDLNRDRGRDRRKPLSIKDSLFASNSGKVAPGFGIGALEELDAEDDDVYASGFEIENTYVEEIEEPSRVNVDNNRKLLTGKEQDILPGFKVASNDDYQSVRYNPPTIPKEFVPVHKFSGPLELDKNLTECPPPDAPPPNDNNMKVLIDGIAKLVAQCGKLFEDLSKERNQSNPLFSFMFGGEGHDYYMKRLWEEKQKRKDQSSIILAKYSSETVQKMTAEARGNMLGEKPLPKSVKESTAPAASSDIQLKYNLSDTFAEPLPINKMLEIAKPFQNDRAKEERFEQFLKQKYLGGLRSTSSYGSNMMSEDARARERLDFEAAAEVIEKAQRNKENQLSMQELIEMSAIGGMQFTSGGFEQPQATEAAESTSKKLYPKREEFQWRPSPILCKRFDLSDPYMGKPPTAPRVRSKMDSLIFTADSVKPTKVEETVTTSREVLTSPDHFETNKNSSDNGSQEEVEVVNVERPVDLYKAIFSDDSDDEEEIPLPIPVKEDNKKMSEVVNTTLSRLTAGDFLESLGKELGLEVPPDMPQSTSKAKTVAPPSDPVDVSKVNTTSAPVKNRPHSPIAGSVTDAPSRQLEIHGKQSNNSGHGYQSGDPKKEADVSRHEQLRSDSLSSGEKSRKHYKRHRHRSSSSDSDSSISGEDRHQSRSRSSKKRSSREKSSSGSKHRSKHHKHRSKDSSRKSSHRDSDKDYRKDKRRKERD
ncbi:unnamed protein product [Rhodiola kirilowii]